LNSRKLVGLFFKTLFLGAFVSLVASFFVNAHIYSENLQPFDAVGLIGLFLWYTVYGMLYSIVSQAGFFAYLFIHRFGLGLFRNFWPTVQIGLIAFVIFDLIYFPYKATQGEVALYWWILMSFSLLGVGIIVATIKAKQTHPRAFVPALFLMVVMTAIEWVPGLQTEGTDYATLMIFTLVACNAYQLLVLHKLSGSKAREELNNSKQKHHHPKKKGNKKRKRPKKA